MYKIIIALVCITCILVVAFESPPTYPTPERATLATDGFVLVPQVLTGFEADVYRAKVDSLSVKELQAYIFAHHGISMAIANSLPSLATGYTLQDYIWVIQQSSVHTFHRDNNAKFFNQGQKYPSYTMLLFLTDMPSALLVIPQSHDGSHGISIRNHSVSIPVRKGDAIIFDAGLVHAGSLDRNQHNPRIQLKISHRDDLGVLSYYQQFAKYTAKPNRLPLWLKKCQQNALARCPFISDLYQNTNIATARGSSQGARIPLSQKMYSLIFYGDSSYYDLPDGM